MDTQSDRSSENRYENPPAAGGPRLGGPSASAAAPLAEELAEEDAWPGVAPPAGWFLRAPGDSGPAGASGQVAVADPAPVTPCPGGWPAQPVVGATRALRGLAGGPGFQPGRPGAGSRRGPADVSPWQTSQRLWRESDIHWQPRPAPPQPAQRSARVPLGAPVFAVAGTDPTADTGPAAGTDPAASTDPAPPGHQVQPAEDSWWPVGHPAPLWNRAYDEISPLSTSGPVTGRDTLLLEPERPGVRRSNSRRGRLGRRTAAIAVPVAVLGAVAVLALALLTGHGPKFSQLTEGQSGGQQSKLGTPARSPLTIAMYPGQQQHGVFQAVSRIVASGNTIVAIGSQASDGLIRQQFFVSANGGASWRLAPLRTPGGGQPPLGYPAARVAGGPGGWLAEGPQALWTSPDGLSWTLAATHGITPQLPHDVIFVLTKTADGFVAAGQAAAPGGGSQAVIWTSHDGLSWQRMTAAERGLAGPGESVRGIYYATWRGSDISTKLTSSPAERLRTRSNSRSISPATQAASSYSSSAR